MQLFYNWKISFLWGWYVSLCVFSVVREVLQWLTLVTIWPTGKLRESGESANSGVVGISSTVKQEVANPQIFNHFSFVGQVHIFQWYFSSWHGSPLIPSFTGLPCNYVISYHHQGTCTHSNLSHTSVPQGRRHYFCEFQSNDLLRRNDPSWFHVTHSLKPRARHVLWLYHF